MDNQTLMSDVCATLRYPCQYLDFLHNIDLLAQIQREIGYAATRTLRQPIPRAHPQRPRSLARSAARSSASHPQCSGAHAGGLLQAWLPCNTCRIQEGKVNLKAAKGRSAKGKRQQQTASSGGHNAAAARKQGKGKRQSTRQAVKGTRQKPKASREMTKGSTSRQAA